MRQGSKQYSDMRQDYFLNSTCYIAINKRQRHATLAFLKIERRHGDPPVKGPRDNVGWNPGEILQEVGEKIYQSGQLRPVVKYKNWVKVDRKSFFVIVQCY